MTDELPPAYRQTVDHLLFDPRPGPRHHLRTGTYPRRPSELYPRKEPTVAYDDERDDGALPSSRQVFDPGIGSDGGGRYGSALASIDPDQPIRHVDDLTRADPVEPYRGDDPLDHGTGDLVPCPACGTGVSPDRIHR